jgi:hypothetical protein
MLAQLAAVLAFGVSLAFRIGSPGEVAGVPSLVASAAGLVTLLVGDHLGGLLVYRDGMRVRSGGR